MIIRKLKPTDCEGMFEWMSDPNINQFFKFDKSNITKEKILKFIYKSDQLLKNKINYHFAIVDAKDEYLGTISLKNVDLLASSGEYAISLRKCAQGTGISTKATSDILDYAFNTLNLNRVYLNVLSENQRAVNFYLKYGFIYEGEFRKHLFLNGELKSIKWFSILKEEFENIK